MKHLTLSFLVCALACPAIDARQDSRELAQQFFDHYTTRDDWLSFLDLYSDELLFQDVIFRFDLGKSEFAEFYNWEDPLLSKDPDYPEVITLEDLAVTENSAVGRGYFNPFFYDGNHYTDTDHMRFTMWLEFDEEGLITRHIDWIEYPPEFLVTAGEMHLEASAADTAQTPQ